MKALLVKTNGKQEKIKPANGTDFTLEEAQGYVGGYIEIVHLPRTIMVVNEEGAINGMVVNPSATLLATCYFGAFTPIYGDVIICNNGMIR